MTGMPTPRNELIEGLADANRKLTEAIERIKAAAEHSARESNGAGGGSGSTGVRFRKLRITWTVAWVSACIPLLVLWALSYWEINYWDIQLDKSGGINVWVVMGRICAEPNIGPQRWDTDRVGLGREGSEYWNEYPRWEFGNNDRDRWIVPAWFPVMLASAFAAAPWIPWSTRFSIRAILILTTLVASVLGLIVYSMSN
jgi:hypothetical protein